MPQPVSGNVQLGLRVSAALCALVSLLALVAHIFGFLPMPFFLTFFGVPSLVLLFALAALGRRLNARVFLRCLLVGLLGGIVATLAYDLTKYGVRVSGLFDFDGFKAIYIFGGWITGRETSSVTAGVAGWLYHFWNGISFGIFYTLAFGRRHWMYGVVYGGVMEACMLGLFPLFVQITNKIDFIGVSMFGHLVYGAALGMIAQKHALSWKDAV